MTYGSLLNVEHVCKITVAICSLSVHVKSYFTVNSIDILRNKNMYNKIMFAGLRDVTSLSKGGKGEKGERGEKVITCQQ